MSNRKDVFDKIKAEGVLPAPSKTALEVLRVAQSESTSLDEVADIIMLDPVLSAELLRYANASFLSTGIQVTSIRRATVKLGLKSVVNLAIGLSLVSANKTGKCLSFNYNTFWSLSLGQALAAKEIAEVSKVYDSEDMFVCGLLSHMGELAFASLYPEEYDVILDKEQNRERRKAIERKEFGIDGAELTIELFLDWGLPASYALAAGFHEDLDSIELDNSRTKDIAKLLQLSFRIVFLSQSSEQTSQWLDATESMSYDLGVSLGHFPDLFNTIVAAWQEWGESFNIPTPPCPAYEEIKANALRNKFSHLANS